MSEPLNIHQKLLEIRKQVLRIGKDDTNEHYDFKFVSSTAVLKRLRVLMDEQGLLLIPEVINSKITIPGKQIITELTMKYIWVNVEDSTQQIGIPWYGQGLDSGERGVGKALTYSEKYFLLKFFNIPTDNDDPDSKNEEVEPKAQTASKEQITQIKDMAVKHDIDLEKMEKYIKDRNWGDWNSLTKDTADHILSRENDFIESIKKK